MGDNRKPRRIGIREIAEEAKLSKSAVSYALNGTGRLGPETRERVIEIARKLGYKVNPNARNLRRQNFGVLSLSVSLPSEMSEALPGMDYFMQVWRGAMTAALERGYMMLLTPFGAKPSMVRNMPIDGGIIVDPLAGDPMAGHLAAQGLPVVLIGRDIERCEEEIWIVDSPHSELATKVFAHLQEQGASRIGLILASRRYSFSLSVCNAYLDWIQTAGQEPIIIEIDGPPTESSGYEAAMRMLDSEHPPQAIYTSLDRLAAGALLAAEQRGIDVPSNLLLASGSDGITRMTRVPITALDLKPDLLGRAAVTMLVERIEQNVEPRHTIVPGELIVRASTVPCSG